MTTNLTKTHSSVMQKHARRLNQGPEQAINSFYNPFKKQQAPPVDEIGQVPYKTIDMNYNFIRSLFLDRVLENPILYSAFLENRITSMSQLE